MQKTGLFYLFYFLKYLSLKLWPLIMHHPLVSKMCGSEVTCSKKLQFYGSSHFELISNSSKLHLFILLSQISSTPSTQQSTNALRTHKSHPFAQQRPTSRATRKLGATTK
jgi:hypothetical protein